jgi:hypothetical protein
VGSGGGACWCLVLMRQTVHFMMGPRDMKGNVCLSLSALTKVRNRGRVMVDAEDSPSSERGTAEPWAFIVIKKGFSPRGWQVGRDGNRMGIESEGGGQIR